MTQEDYSVLDDPDEVEFVGDALIVPVLVDFYEEEYQGSSRDEDYYERVDMGDDVLEVDCPLEYVYNDADPNEEYTGSEAVSFLQSESWDSQEIVDLETMEFRKDGELYIASFDSSELDEYRF